MKQRFIPADWMSREYKDANAVIYFSEKNGIYYAMAYSGKRSKTDFHYRFNSEQHMETYISEYLKRLFNAEKVKAERKQNRASFKHTLKVGDILECSWGYEQTNVDFYQVTAVKEKTVKIRAIRASMTDGETGFMTGQVIPVRDGFKSEEMIKRVSEGNRIGITSYSSASLWDGRPCRVSWYA